jgi:hypothetical protein
MAPPPGTPQRPSEPIPLPRRRKAGKAHPIPVADLVRLAREAQIPVTQCPPGVACAGWVPRWL